MLIHVVVQNHNRLLYILFFSQKKIEDNTQELAGVTKGLYKLSMERRNHNILVGDGSVDLLSKRMKDAIDMQNSTGVKNAVCPIELPKVEKLPQYTTWVFLRRCVMGFFFVFQSEHLYLECI